MTDKTLSQIPDIVDLVKSWPPAERISLARKILESVENLSPQEIDNAPRGPSAAEVVEKFRTHAPPPDDATVKQWIHEHRMEKYGQ